MNGTFNIYVPLKLSTTSHTGKSSEKRTHNEMKNITACRNVAPLLCNISENRASIDG